MESRKSDNSIQISYVYVYFQISIIYICTHLDIFNIIIIRILRENEKRIIKGESIEYPRNDDTTPVAIIVVA